MNDNLDTGIAACGQMVGLIHDIPAVKEDIDHTVVEAEETVGASIPGRSNRNIRLECAVEVTEACIVT